MNHFKKQDNGPIRVADLSHAQLSRGVYRSTAAAFKELVTNAYDADASVVEIHTNYPQFDYISCVDNGTGMPLAEFCRYFSQEGIGSCIKRKHKKDVTDGYKRPIIGKMGIGMLAIGQLCDSFEIESHYRDDNVEGHAYRAQIVLADVDIPARGDVLRDDDVETKKVEMGTWRYDRIPYDPSKQGFRIYSDDVRQTFQAEMKKSVTEKDRKKMSFSQSELHRRFYDAGKKAVRECQAYLEAIWEVAILSPLPYYKEGKTHPIDLAAFEPTERGKDDFKKAVALIRRRHRLFLKYNFRVLFDGIELRRHIRLPTRRKSERESKISPTFRFIEFNNDDVAGSPLEFSGYLLGQVAAAVRPLELNGAQIRLRGVGIGGYDSTFLRYYKEVETIRSRWVTGEIFVDRGLEDALNLDRDSFNEHDEHFKALQEFLHEKLDPFFNDLARSASKRSADRRSEREEEASTRVKTLIADHLGHRIKVKERELQPDDPPVQVDEARREIIINSASRPLKKKKADTVIRAVMLAYHAASTTAKKGPDRDAAFYELLKKSLRELL